MDTSLPLKLKRREIILLALALLTVFGFYHSVAAVDLALLLGVLSVINLYFVYRNLYSQRYVGLVAALFLAFSPWHYRSSTLPDGYAIAVFLATAAMLVCMGVFGRLNVSRTVRNRSWIRHYGFWLLAISIPYATMFLLSLPIIIASAGGILTALGLICVPTLWLADEKHQNETVFLTLWLFPSLIAMPLFGTDAADYAGFAVLPLALLSCRLLERLLDGQWLEYWWAAGLSSNWYYRLAKVITLGTLVISAAQTLKS